MLPPAKPGGWPLRSRRPVIDGIRWRVRTGAPWRDLPERYGPWGVVAGLAAGRDLGAGGV
ncbi:transposase [Cryptosporangium japonicum]|uniref:transposase n=1 Tax=Cryptosporangium japonicum TaxID=80872 RepID=UPI0031E42CFA